MKQSNFQKFCQNQWTLLTMQKLNTLCTIQNIFYTAKMRQKCTIFLKSHFKGTVQRELFGWKWYQSTDLSQKDWRRDY
jgi:hypothetical protein